MKYNWNDVQTMIEDKECPIIDDWNALEDDYRGLVIEINDHGNVTLWNHFKNGNNRELASWV